jgi:hypothetical protein
MAEIYYGQKVMNQIISHLDGVPDAVHDVAQDRAGQSKALLAGHRDTGAAEITVTRGETDSFVNLDDPAALSIEFGHWVKGKYERDTPQFVPGIYVLTIV